MSLCVFFCILCTIGYALAASGDPWETSGFLRRGEAAIHQIEVDGSNMLKLTYPLTARFTLYAMQTAIAGVQSCPSETALRGMAFYKSQDSLTLPRGQWCIEVYASKGSGRYYLEYATSTPKSDPPTIQPTITMAEASADSLIPDKVSPQSGTISPKSSNVHSFLVSGKRIFLEWILEPSDCTTPVALPEVMISTQYLNELQSAVCSLDLNAYLYKDCDPRSEQCTPIAFDEGPSPYAYIGVPYPQDKSKYYLLVKSGEGSGSYTLTSRSYVLGHDPSINENNEDAGIIIHSISYSSSFVTQNSAENYT